MLTWETLIECINDDNVNDEIRLICKLFVTVALLSHIPTGDFGELFNEYRNSAMETELNEYRIIFNQ